MRRVHAADRIVLTFRRNDIHAAAYVCRIFLDNRTADQCTWQQVQTAAVKLCFVVLYHAVAYMREVGYYRARTDTVIFIRRVRQTVLDEQTVQYSTVTLIRHIRQRVTDGNILIPHSHGIELFIRCKQVIRESYHMEGVSFCSRRGSDSTG